MCTWQLLVHLPIGTQAGASSYLSSLNGLSLPAYCIRRIPLATSVDIVCTSFYQKALRETTAPSELMRRASHPIVALQACGVWPSSRNGKQHSGSRGPAAYPSRRRASAYAWHGLREAHGSPDAVVCSTDAVEILIKQPCLMQVG